MAGLENHPPPPPPAAGLCVVRRPASVPTWALMCAPARAAARVEVMWGPLTMLAFNIGTVAHGAGSARIFALNPPFSFHHRRYGHSPARVAVTPPRPRPWCGFSRRDWTPVGPAPALRLPPSSSHYEYPNSRERRTAPTSAIQPTCWTLRPRQRRRCRGRCRRRPVHLNDDVEARVEGRWFEWYEAGADFVSFCRCMENS